LSVKNLTETVNVGPPSSSSYTRILRSAASGSFRDFPGPGATEPRKETAYDMMSMLDWMTKLGEVKKKGDETHPEILGAGAEA
jgi:hypothetical protein